MRTLPRISDKSAFTLVEIMIASAILIVLSLAISSMMFNSAKQQTKIEDRARDTDFVQGAALDMRLKPVAP